MTRTGRDYEDRGRIANRKPMKAPTLSEPYSIDIQRAIPGLSQRWPRWTLFATKQQNTHKCSSKDMVPEVEASNRIDWKSFIQGCKWAGWSPSQEDLKYPACFRILRNLFRITTQKRLSVEISKLEIPEILSIRPAVYQDERGFFLEAYREEAYARAHIGPRFVQDNHSHSKQGTLRGLHYQIQHAQGKLVSVLQGTIFDAAVDLRTKSPTFGNWVGIQLSSDQHEQLWIPPGFAHGFYVLSQTADVIYKVTDYYSKESERVLAWNDPEVGIRWPLINNLPPTLSIKDSQGKLLHECDHFI
jgi:dTDP-4-dehydrorhamnose 3,5-epimerase